MLSYQIVDNNNDTRIDNIDVLVDNVSIEMNSRN